MTPIGKLPSAGPRALHGTTPAISRRAASRARTPRPNAANLPDRPAHIGISAIVNSAVVGGFAEVVDFRSGLVRRAS